MIATLGIPLAPNSISSSSRHKFTGPSGSRIIDLPGERLNIMRIDFNYKSINRREGKGIVEVFARWDSIVVASRGSRSSSAPPSVDPSQQNVTASAHRTVLTTADHCLLRTDYLRLAAHVHNLVAAGDTLHFGETFF